MAGLTEFYRQQRRRGHPPPIRARLDESSARSGRWGQAGRRRSFVEERRSRDERTPPPPPSVPPDLYCEEGVGGEKGAAPPEVSRGPSVLLLDAATNTRPLLLLPRPPRARAHGRPPNLPAATERDGSSSSASLVFDAQCCTRGIFAFASSRWTQSHRVTVIKTV
jgi:hypothetical protein